MKDPEKILRLIPTLEDHPNYDADLGKITRRIIENRAERLRFERLLDALTNERRWAWIRKKADPSEEWKLDPDVRHVKDREEIELFRKIVQYIRDRGKPTTMRDLERRFHVLAPEIERALVWNLDSGLRIGTRGKTLLFYWKPRTSAEIEILNERAGEKAIREAVERSNARIQST
jgi:hypothetical protein